MSFNAGDPGHVAEHNRDFIARRHQVVTLPPRTYQWWYGGTGIAMGPPVTAQPPWMPTVASTITSIVVDVATGVASSSLVMGLYETDENGAPTNLVATLATFDCSTLGQKTVTGLTQAVTPGTGYRIVVLPVGAPNLRGMFNSTQGTQVGNLPSIGGLGDNLSRAQHYTYTPAVSGTLDAAPTWLLNSSNQSFPNHRIVLEAA